MEKDGFGLSRSVRTVVYILICTIAIYMSIVLLALASYLEFSYDYRESTSMLHYYLVNFVLFFFLFSFIFGPIGIVKDQCEPLPQALRLICYIFYCVTCAILYAVCVIIYLNSKMSVDLIRIVIFHTYIMSVVYSCCIVYCVFSLFFLFRKRHNGDIKEWR